MKKLIRNSGELLTLFIFFGTLYYLIESIWKHHFTDWRMFILAGLIGTAIGLLNNIFTYEMDFLSQCLIGAQSATLLEAIFGYRWNVEMGLALWNYSNPPLSRFSFCADQINLLFVIVWVFFSGIAVILADFIHYFLFKNIQEEKPYYKILGRKFCPYK